MLKNVSLRIRLILSTVLVVIMSVLLIGGFNLYQFYSFSRDTMAQTRQALEQQGAANMQIRVKMDRQKINMLVEKTNEVAKKLAASFQMRTYVTAEKEVLSNLEKEIYQQLVELWRLCNVQHKQLQKKLEADLQVAKHLLNNHGQPTFSDVATIPWTAVNQVTGEEALLTLPQLMIGKTPLSRYVQPEREVPVVDEVKNVLNVRCTILQRMNETGDLLRIATNVRQADGARAIGTYIPASLADGKANPIVTTLLKGEPAYGRVTVADSTYLTAYAPLLNEADRVIGALAVHTQPDQEAIADALVERQRDFATDSESWQRGNVFAMDSSGTIVIHSETKQIGTNLLEELPRTVEQQLLAAADQTVTTLTNANQTPISTIYFAPWDWIIGLEYNPADIVREAKALTIDRLQEEIELIYQTATIQIEQQDVPIFGQICYVDEHGQEMIALQRGQFTDNLQTEAGEYWFQQSLMLQPGKTENFGVEIAPNTEQPEMRVTAGVFVNNQNRGVVTVNLDWNVIWQLLKNQVYGKSGYAYILNEKGVVVSHPTYTLTDRVNLGRNQYGMLADIVRGQMLQGEAGTAQYTLEEIAYFTAFVPLPIGEMTYTVVAETPAEEFLSEEAKSLTTQTERKFGATLSIIMGVMVFGTILGLIMGYINSQSVTQPIVRVAEFAQKVSQGDLSETLAVDRKDEVGLFLSHINEIAQSLRQFIDQIQQSAIQITSSSTELSATAKEQDTIVTNQVEFTNRMVQSVKEISDVTAELVQTMEQVSAMSEETAGFATSGQSDLARMKDAMGHMEHASKAISNKLGTINEKAENITTVVTTITKVADQTNLLSLNAAIEAEKAGEYGRGFTVVAREIRRLADQTAVSTLDIEQMVKEMQSAVSAGVMEMDKFINEVRSGAEDVGKISMQLTRIIEQVQAISPRFEEVNVAMGNQSQHAQRINGGIQHLSEEMQQTKASLDETYSAIEQLKDAARRLQDQVSQYKV
jgi:methyl-accepting chemotaxis protein